MVLRGQSRSSLAGVGALAGCLAGAKEDDLRVLYLTRTNAQQKQVLLELREMISYTNLTRGLFFSNHASNYLSVKARLPRGKQQALDLIDSALKGETPLRPDWVRGL